MSKIPSISSQVQSVLDLSRIHPSTFTSLSILACNSYIKLDNFQYVLTPTGLELLQLLENAYVPKISKKEPLFTLDDVPF